MTAHAPAARILCCGTESANVLTFVLRTVDNSSRKSTPTSDNVLNLKNGSPGGIAVEWVEVVGESLYALICYWDKAPGELVRRWRSHENCSHSIRRAPALPCGALREAGTSHLQVMLARRPNKKKSFFSTRPHHSATWSWPRLCGAAGMFRVRCDSVCADVSCAQLLRRTRCRDARVGTNRP